MAGWNVRVITPTYELNSGPTLRKRSRRNRVLNVISERCKLMAELSKKYIIAEAEISAVISLVEMAAKLSSIIGGITFKQEVTGRFEEVPAFVADDGNSGMQLILFGIPEGETGDAYLLECSAETDLSIEEFSKNVNRFLSGILVENGKEIDSRGYFDFSDELASALARRLG